MSSGLKLTGLLLAGFFCFAPAARADTQTPHRVHKVKKQPPPAPLPSGTQGPVPQVPLDAIPAVAPQVSFQDGLLTIVAPNSTLADVLRSVRKHTAAEIEIPATASERVVTRLGPGPAREVMAELLNGSRFNYILLGSPQDANALVRVVLVAKLPPDAPAPTPGASGTEPPSAEVAGATPDAPEPDSPEDSADDSPDQAAADADQPAQPDQPGVKTPQQLLQEMQQHQMQVQQQQQAVQPPMPGTPFQPRPLQQQPPQDQQ